MLQKIVLSCVIASAYSNLLADSSLAQGQPSDSIFFSKPVLKPGLDSPVKEFPDYQKRYSDELESEIYSNWHPVRSCKQTKFKVHFFIDKNGEFHDISVMHPAEDRKADLACINAVKKSSGFRKHVPAGINEVEITLKKDRKNEGSDVNPIPQTKSF